MLEFINLFAKIILEFSHESLIVPLIIIGYIWIDKKTFFHGICLVLISMIFNAGLKATFQIPLSPALGKEGFAFPSGHMQTSIVLYGFLYKFSKNTIIKVSLVILLTLIAMSLIYFGYHNIYDILGALFFGLMLIFGYVSIKSKMPESRLFLAIILFTTCCMLYIRLIYQISPHLWMAYYALFGLLVSEYFFDNKQIKLDAKKSKIIATIFCFSSLFLTNILFALLPNALSFLQSLRWFLIGFFIPFSVFLSYSIHCKGKAGDS
ncbi:MAG: hypothetical protein COA94_00480 [Rickettsiales bacterium]|nr:MAG: hypothetical protein COA94_00480 [Rickettsiales bacterium]